jgi:hypothetical protein
MTRKIFSMLDVDVKSTALNVALVAGALVWYFLFFTFLKHMCDSLNFQRQSILEIFGANFFSLASSAIVSAIIVVRIRDGIRLLYYWLILLPFISLFLMYNFSGVSDVLVISIVFGLFFGAGMPCIMGYYASTTSVLNRSRVGGIVFLVVSLCFAIIGSLDVTRSTTVVGILLAIPLIVLLFLRLLKLKDIVIQRKVETSFTVILTSRSFVLYFLPWCMFSLVNYMIIPVLSQIFHSGEQFVHSSAALEYVISAAFAFVGGFLADIFGRKRLAMIGFIMLGFGYAVLGLAQNIVGWCFYTIIDGIAWGIFYSIFFFTIWGDLAEGRSSEKYYAVGVMPYLFSNFMRLLLEPYVSLIPTTALFSFASVFLFAAVLPLVYAPETLPESVIRARQLKSYIEKAKKFKEKYS